MGKKVNSPNREEGMGMPALFGFNNAAAAAKSRFHEKATKFSGDLWRANKTRGRFIEHNILSYSAKV
jgi:hypothetical protein